MGQFRGEEAQKGSTKDSFTFDGWFESKRSAEDVMDIGADTIGMAKINKKGLCNDTVKNLRNDYPGGYYLMLK